MTANELSLDCDNVHEGRGDSCTNAGATSRLLPIFDILSTFGKKTRLCLFDRQVFTENQERDRDGRSTARNLRCNNFRL